MVRGSHQDSVERFHRVGPFSKNDMPDVEPERRGFELEILEDLRGPLEHRDSIAGNSKPNETSKTVQGADIKSALREEAGEFRP